MKEWQLNGLDDNIKWRLTTQNNLCLVLMFNEVCLGDFQVSEVRRQRVFDMIFFLVKPSALLKGDTLDVQLFYSTAVLTVQF